MARIDCTAGGTDRAEVLSIDKRMIARSGPMRLVATNSDAIRLRRCQRVTGLHTEWSTGLVIPQTVGAWFEPNNLSQGRAVVLL